MRKKIAKGKSLTGSSGRESVKGSTGIAAAYVTRNRALKKLQVSLKDFRRLCILKGVFPRDPKKKNAGRDKLYYHVKDIQFLSHEPLLNKFRSMKIFLKKHKRATIRKEKSRIETLESQKPLLSLDHLIKERYPHFIDALRDIDDALNLLFLFSLLPAGVTRSHTADRVEMCERLTQEFVLFVCNSHSLRKVFISIKGIYCQATIQGQTINFIIPHQFAQFVPSDVDYRVMLTFLSFYETLMKFVNFKLFHDIGLAYPPTLNRTLYDQRGGLNARAIKKLESDAGAAPAEFKSANAKPSSAKNEKLQKQINEKIKEIKGNQKRSANANAEEQNEFNSDSDSTSNDSDAMEFPVSTETPVDADSQLSTLFAGLTFLISREVPRQVCELIIRSAGGRAVGEEETKTAGLNISHQICDRPEIESPAVDGRVYVQPQFLFDSFNSRVLLPASAYRPGQPLPPHLSPFVDDSAEGYIPAQRDLLTKWGAESQKNSASAARSKNTDNEINADDSSDSGSDSDSSVDEEAESSFSRDLSLERRGVKYSDASTPAESANRKRNRKMSANSTENENSAESEDEQSHSDESSSAPAAKLPGRVSDESKESERHELAKLMMGKKSARLYSRMQYGLKSKRDENEVLKQKRQKIEKEKKSKANNK